MRATRFVNVFGGRMLTKNNKLAKYFRVTNLQRETGMLALASVSCHVFGCDKLTKHTVGYPSQIS
jgi:hypothetical protein